MKFTVPIILLVTALLTAPITAQESVSGIDLKAMDSQVRPQDDFYQYVNGKWLRETEIPADKSRYSMFSVLSDRTQEQLQTIIKDSAKKNAAKGTNEQKLGDMYKSFLNVEKIEALGYDPVKDVLKDIAEVSGPKELGTELARLDKLGVSGPFGFYVYPDAKSPGIYGLWMFQSGLTMPDRDYYLKPEEKYQNFRKEFETYAADMFRLVDYPNPEEAAARVLALETEIAQRHLTRVESRDAEKNYNKRSAQEVKALLEGFPWDEYAAASGLESADEIIVRNYPYFEAVGKLFSDTDLQTWKDYLTFQALDHYADALSSDFEDRHFKFHSTTLNGVPENEPRWKRAVNSTSGVLGEVLGQEYVKRHFSPEAKRRMEVLVANLTKAYGESIVELEWMSDETKEKALAKLAAFKPKIGYPDKWRDYSDLKIDPDDLVGNFERSAEFEHNYNLAKIGKPVDPVDWSMTPQTINAYYSPTRNEIVFPAAILQPPFFDLDADDAVNYGAIGGVIGHEIGHGFDDQGSKYDGSGNLRSWWTEEDRKAFDLLGKQLIEQYNAFSPLEDQSVNGELTLGENIGDLAGVTIGYKAYLMSLDGREPPVIDGFTGPQRLFMGWAQVWRGKIREDALRARLLSDPHSPAEYRVIGPLRNVDAFYQAFEVQPEDDMYLPPNERVKIW
jgi:putative endopeptidase